jgi:hypothetical protein
MQTASAMNSAVRLETPDRRLHTVFPWGAFNRPNDNVAARIAQEVAAASVNPFLTTR